MRKVTYINKSNKEHLLKELEDHQAQDSNTHNI